MLRVQPWRAFISCDNAWSSLACKFFSTHLLLGKRVERCCQISSHGRYCNSRGVVSDGTLCPSGYRAVQICGRQFFVHRLVAFAFLGPPADPCAWQVNHRDGNPANNNLENLEYATARQNILHSKANSSRDSSNHGLSKAVMWRAVGSKDWKTCGSMSLVTKETGVSQKLVRKSCNENMAVKGFEFCEPFSAENKDTAEVWRPLLDPKSGQEVRGRRVSSLGRLQFLNGRISAGYLRKHGYRATSVNARMEYVHRLVAFAFLGPPPTLQHTQVNHKDHDSGNNAVENLQYVSASENVQHSYTKAAKRRPTSNVKPIESRLSGSQDEWTKHRSIQNAARACGMNPGSVYKWAHCSGSHKGKFEFRFAEDPSTQTRAGEEWRGVDVAAHLDERLHRKLST